VDAPALSYSSAPGRWVVAITVLGSGIAALDATVVNIALPTIGRDFHTGIAALQWVMTSYILTLAAFLLIGGSLGDRFGRRKVYLLGVVWFALASAACGFAPNADFLIITRVLQGIGGALLTPGSLAILESSFRPADRARAIGAWSGLGGVAVAAGPLIGGYLISAASWRWIFFINIPIAAVVVALGARHVPESHDPGATGRLDYAGALAAVVFLTASRSPSSRRPRSAGRPRPCSRWRCSAWPGWPVSWPGSSGPPRRCCRWGSSGTGSSRRPAP
jgi:MFS family permease